MAAFNPAAHPRAPKGTATGGQFAVVSGKSGGNAPAPSAKPGRNGARYSRKQFGQLQSLLKQQRAGKKLTPQQRHELHVAHELHVQHQQAMAARTAKPAKRTAAKKVGSAAARKTAAAAVPVRSRRGVRAA